MSRRVQIKTLLFFIAIITGNACGRAAEIKFYPIARNTSAIVRLGDIAEIVGTPDEVARLRRIEIAVAPVGLNSRTLNWTRIRELLILRGVSPVKHRLSGASEILLKNNSRQMASQATAAIPGTGSQPGAPLVIVSTRPLKQGMQIGRDDVRLEPLKTRKTPEMATTVESVIGMEVARSMAPGQVIQHRSLRAPILVKRSDTVTVYARAGKIRVRTTAKSLSSGSLHDTIMLEVVGTKDKIAAKIIGFQEAEVFVQGTSEAAMRKSEQSRRARYVPSRRENSRTARSPQPFRTTSYQSGVQQR